MQKLEELLQSCAAQPCRQQKPAMSSTSSDDSLQEPASSFDLEDVTHIITSSPTYSGFQAVEKYNSRVTKVADDAGRQAGTAPLKPGQRGELIAVVTVRPRTLHHAMQQKQRLIAVCFGRTRDDTPSRNGLRVLTISERDKKNNSTLQTQDRSSQA